MSTNVKTAIETTYGGIKFRSRLEARWAVFFDTLHIHWEYEREAYNFEARGYLPDFELPELGLYAEVKGNGAAVTDDYLEMLGNVGHFLPGVHNTGDQSPASGLLLLGDIPRADHYATRFVRHTLLSHRKGLSIKWASFVGSEYSGRSTYLTSDKNLTFPMESGPWVSNECEECDLPYAIERYRLWDAEVIYDDRVAGYTSNTALHAYQVARKHRFWNP